MDKKIYLNANSASIHIQTDSDFDQCNCDFNAKSGLIKVVGNFRKKLNITLIKVENLGGSTSVTPDSSKTTNPIEKINAIKTKIDRN